MSSVYTVAQITSYIKHMFEEDFALNRVLVRGEVSNCKYHTSGHIYFTLKDGTGTIACVMFAGSRHSSDVRLRDGMEIIAGGSIRIYERDSRYQLYVSSLQETGTGELYRIFEERRQKLEEMGIFSSLYKKPIPTYVSKVGVITAETGAAIHDIINISSRRNPYVQLILCPALVQGDGAAESIVRAIERMDRMGCDVLIVGRGGGSIEDLWAFNEEEVVMAIFQCDTPVISAVGHETDFTLADFAADLRAPTPSAAAELAVYDVAGLEALLVDYRDRLLAGAVRKCQGCRDQADRAFLKLKLLHPQKRMEENRREANDLSDRMNRSMKEALKNAKISMQLLSQRLELNSPLHVLAQGYTLVLDEEGQPVKSTDRLAKESRVEIRFHDGAAVAEIKEVRRNCQ